MKKLHCNNIEYSARWYIAEKREEEKLLTPSIILPLRHILAHVAFSIPATISRKSRLLTTTAQCAHPARVASRSQNRYQQTPQSSAKVKFLRACNYCGSAKRRTRAARGASASLRSKVARACRRRGCIEAGGLKDGNYWIDGDLAGVILLR